MEFCSSTQCYRHSKSRIEHSFGKERLTAEALVRLGIILLWLPHCEACGSWDCIFSEICKATKTKTSIQSFFRLEAVNWLPEVSVSLFLTSDRYWHILGHKVIVNPNDQPLFDWRLHRTIVTLWNAVLVCCRSFKGRETREYGLWGEEC